MEQMENNSDRKPHLFIVDDEPANIKMLSVGLRDDYEISVAVDGQEAVDAISKAAASIDLILLDVNMPGLSGYIVCSALKRMKQTKHIPVIFITARNTVESEEKGLDLGAVDYITKPFSMPIVQARVRTHVMLKSHIDLLRKLVSEQSSKVRKYETEYKRLLDFPNDDDSND